MKNKKKDIQLPPYDAVIFDMDGVLVNTEPIYAAVEQKNFRKLGLSILEEEHKTFQGTATDSMWQDLKKKYAIKETVEELVQMTNSIVTPYFASLHTIETMPGVELLLKGLKNKEIPLALASSSYPDVIDIILHKTGMKDYFDAVIDGQMAGTSKPEPDIFLLAAKILDVLPERCIVIEDSENGIKAAKLAGMYCIAYAGPGTELQDQSQADMVIDSFDELADSLLI
jgi:beta-phosphoglucomutase family hydrolase